MRHESSRIGELDCQVVSGDDTTGPPKAIVVLCHGYGAPGDDLVSIGQHVLELEPRLEQYVRFVFPAAPLSLESIGMPGGRAWWHLDVEELVAATQSGDFAELTQRDPEAMADGRSKLLNTIQLISEETDVPMSRIVIGGFSQGAILTTDLSFYLDENPAALFVMSGTLMCLERWKSLATARAGMKVVQCHGKMDPILPFIAAEWLHEFFRECELDAEFMPFMGPHMIPGPVLYRLKDLLLENLDA